MSIQYDYTMKYLHRDLRSRLENSPYLPFAFSAEQRKLHRKRAFENKTLRSPAFNAGALGAGLLLTGLSSPRFSMSKIGQMVASPEQFVGYLLYTLARRYYIQRSDKQYETGIVQPLAAKFNRFVWNGDVKALVKDCEVVDLLAAERGAQTPEKRPQAAEPPAINK